MSEKNQNNGFLHINGSFPEEQESGPDLRKFIDKILKNWYWFLLFLIIGVFTSWLYLRYVTPKYRITAKILVKDDKKGGDIPGQEILQQLEIFSNKSNVDNEVEILRSRSMMEKVVRDMQLNVSYYVKGRLKRAEQFDELPFKFEWVYLKDTLGQASYALIPKADGRFELLRGDLRKEANWNDTIHLPEGILRVRRQPEFAFNQDEYYVNVTSIDRAVATYQNLLDINIPNKQVSVINLTVRTSVPRKGEEIVNKLIDVYLKASIDDKNRIVDSTISFVDNRLAIVSNELTGVEKNIQQFKQQNELADLSEQSKLLVAGTGDNQKQLTDLQVRLNVAESLENYLNDGKNSTRIVPATLIVQDPTFLALVEKYNTLQMERERMLMSTTTTNPFVRNLDAQLETLRANIKSNITSIRQNLQISYNELARTESSLHSKIREVPGKERIFLDFSRQQAIKQELYLFLLKKREESAISKSSNLAIGRIIDPAKSEALPYSPKRSLVYLIGLIAGFSIPAIGSYLREALNRRVTKKQDILSSTPVPILAEVGHQTEGDMTVVSRHSRSPVAEQFRALRTNLQFVLSKKNEKVILLTSSMSGEGKSFVATSLSSVISLSGKKVVLMEMDLRKPKISENLGLQNSIGFSTYVIGKNEIDQIIKPSGIHENFWVISSGPIPPNPAELLLLERTEELFAYLRSEFDYIIIDTAPIGLVADAQLLAKFADTTLYLVRQGYTFKQQLQLSKELYEQNKFAKLNIVVNDVKIGDSYGYSYGYGYGYGDYGAGQEKKTLLKRIKSNLKN